MRKVRLQPYLTIALALVILALLIGKRQDRGNNRVTTIHDTVTVVRTDTLTVTMPGPVRVEAVEKIADRLPVAQSEDTCVTSNDSVDVLVPIERKVYEDSAYRAVVRGYRVELEEIQVFQRTTTRTITNTITRKDRWGIGIQAGISVSPGNIQPYIGIGISYNFITF